MGSVKQSMFHCRASTLGLVTRNGSIDTFDSEDKDTMFSHVCVSADTEKGAD